jgi:GNAT superfamily N-acetyltransferase
MNIRNATAADYEELLDLYGIFLGTNRYTSPGNDSFHDVLSDKKKSVHVAETEGKLIGFATLSARCVVRYPEPIGQIEELFVLEEYRGKKVGALLVAAAEKSAKELGCCRVYIESGYQHAPAHEFYEAKGYRKSGFYFLKKDSAEQKGA